MCSDNQIVYAFSLFSELHSHDWIIDTGASRHMCTDLSLMRNIQAIKSLVKVCLPDVNIKHVEFSGDVSISPDIVLKDVLYIPSFKYNLLSVTQLCSAFKIRCIFLSNGCYIQDLLTERCFGMGELFWQSLYPKSASV